VSDKRDLSFLDICEQRNVSKPRCLHSRPTRQLHASLSVMSQTWPAQSSKGTGGADGSTIIGALDVARALGESLGTSVLKGKEDGDMRKLGRRLLNGAVDGAMSLGPALGPALGVPVKGSGLEVGSLIGEGAPVGSSVVGDPVGDEVVTSTGGSLGTRLLVSTVSIGDKVMSGSSGLSRGDKVMIISSSSSLSSLSSF